MALQIRRGTYAELQTITPLEGELIYTTDTEEVYVGDGVTQGGILVTGSLADLDISSVDVPIPTTTLKDNNSTGTIVISDGASNYSVRVSTTGTYVTGPLVILTTATITTLRFADGTTQTTADTANPDQTLNTTSNVRFAGLTVTNIAEFTPTTITLKTGNQQSVLINNTGSVFLGNGLGGTVAAAFDAQLTLGTPAQHHIGITTTDIRFRNPGATLTFAEFTENTATINTNLVVNGDITANKLTIQYTTVTTTIVETDDIIKTTNSTAATSGAGAIVATGGVSANNLFIDTTATITYTNIAAEGQLRSQSTTWPFGENTATIMTIDTSVYGSARLNILVGASFGLDSHTERLTMDILTNGVDVLNAQSGVLATTSTGLCSYTAELSGTDILVKAVAIDPVNFLGFNAKTIAELVAKPTGGL